MSPDGQRVLYYGLAWTNLSRLAVHDAAHGQCEGCIESHAAAWPKGEAHHLYGRGGGRRDDRPWIPMQTIEKEPNLARWRWKRNLVWTCREGHRLLEALSGAEYRRSLTRVCACGLLVIDSRGPLAARRL